MKVLSSDARTYPSIGRCIYCGSINVPLTDEHIIPYGLHGDWVFEKASCKKCEKKTGAFEQECLRGVYFPIRVRLGMRSRKVKSRPKEYRVVSFDKDDKPHPTTIPTSDLPFWLAMYKFAGPGILAGRPPHGGFLGQTWMNINEDERQALLNKHGFADVMMGRIHPKSFMQMLAKIAHSFAVAEAGLHNFIPFLPKLIIEGIETASYYVGGELEVPPPEPSTLHWVRLNVINGFLTAKLRLLAPYGTPIYQVVLGISKRREDELPFHK